MYFCNNNFDVLGATLLYICNKSIQQGTFPHELKIAKVTRIFKSGERNLISIYRPISVLSSLSKIVEKVMILQLTEYLNVKSLIKSR